MKKVIMLSVVTFSLFAYAEPFKLTPARVGANEVKKEKDDEYAKSFNYLNVQKAYPYLGIVPVKGVPGNKALTDACIATVRKALKTPSVAKFSEVRTPIYNINGGVYTLGGKVDSQNSYGAMLRKTFWCSIVFEGNLKGGTLWIDHDLYDSSF